MSKKIIFSLIAIMVLILTSFLYFSKNMNNFGSCEGIESSIQKNGCLRNLAWTTDNKNACGAMLKSMSGGWADRNSCYTGLMQTNGNYNLCKKVTERYPESNKDKQDCYEKAVIQFSDISLCDKFEEEKSFSDWCYYHIATKKKDISICENIQKNDYKKTCLAALNYIKINCNNLISQNDKNECNANFDSVEIYEVKGGAMEPNYKFNDIAYLNKNTNHYNRGDVILITFPNGEQKSIKRIVGLPNESVQIKDNEVIIYNANNIQGMILDEFYLMDNLRTYSNHNEIIKLKNNEYYVLGDYRNSSKDSRSFGAITKEDILGRVMKTSLNKEEF